MSSAGGVLLGATPAMAIDQQDSQPLALAIDALGWLARPWRPEDEEESETKISFWRDVFLAYQKHLLADHAAAAAAATAAPGASFPSSSSPSTPRPSLSFTFAEIQKSLSRKGEVAPALEPALCRMLTADEIRRVDRWAPAKSAVAARVGSYLWSWVSPTKPLVRMPAGRFAFVDSVRDAARELATALSAADTDVFTLEQLMALSGRSAADVLLLVEQLRLEGMHPLVEAFPAPAGSGARLDVPAAAATRVFKFGAREATAADHSRAVLAQAVRTLRSQADAKEADASARDKEARRLLIEKRRPLALIQLQMKKRATDQVHALHAQIDNLDLLLTHLEQSVSQQQFMQCITEANRTLRQAQSGVSVERVQDVTEELAEHISNVRISEEALAAPVTSALDVDVDAEFESLLADIAAEERAAAAKVANVTVAAPASAAAQQPESAAATTASSAPATTKTKTIVNTTQ